MHCNKHIRTILAGAVSVLALTAVSAAQAQSAADSTESVTVTGSRIANGAAMPTPVTVVSLDQLNNAAPTSIPEALMQLPQFAPTLNATSHVESNGRGFGTPTNNLNLRGLGAIRTLILLDGNRVPGTYYDTTVNVDMLPQLLVQRVDVVSGGASAVYGSDAVAGVVNYVLDHKFDGFKGQVQGGISTYGDAPSTRIGAAAGFDVLKHGHFEMSAEYFSRDAIPDSASRPYGDIAHACQITGSGTAAVPNTLSCNIRTSASSANGLILNGPQNGTQFSADGKSFIPFNPGTTTGTGGANQGGDGGVEHNEQLLAADHNGQAYARFDYDFSNGVSAYADARYGASWTKGAAQMYTNTNASYPIYLYSGNPYLSAAQQAILFPAGAASPGVDIGKFNNDLGQTLSVKQKTNTYALSMGLKGTTYGGFEWDVHGTHGFNSVYLPTINNINTAKWYAALDAVTDPSNGQIVCRATLVTPGAFPGCQPLNILGSKQYSAAGAAYVMQNTGWQAKNRMEDFGANITGTVFEGWGAGPIKTAIGVEYRRQTLGVTTSDPDVTFHPQNLRLGPNGTPTLTTNGSSLAYFKEVQSGAAGAENIAEADVELEVPLLKGLPFAESVVLNGAYRYTAYSTNGLAAAGPVNTSFNANTYKVGLEWSLNDDLRVRASTSRDMRAPTLWDLYQQQVITSSGQTDAVYCDPKAPAGANCVGTGNQGPINTVGGGNPNLKPETSIYNTLGVVATPSFIPGLTASVDYFHVKIGNAIGALGGNSQAAYNVCLESGQTSSLCSLISRPFSYANPASGPVTTGGPSGLGNFPTQVISLNQNIAMNERGGFDTEIGYTTDLNSWTNLNGSLNFRLLWTRQEVVASVSTPGGAYTESVNTAANPRDRANISLGYAYNDFSATVTELWIGQQNWVGGARGSVLAVYTLPPIPAYYLTNLAMTYDFKYEDQPITGFLNINNLFNVYGPITGGFNGSPGMLYPTPTYADIIGRYFTVGVRFKM